MGICVHERMLIVRAHESRTQASYASEFHSLKIRVSVVQSAPGHQLIQGVNRSHGLQLVPDT